MQLERIFSLKIFLPSVTHKHSLCTGLEKVGNLGSSFPGNLTIWREIMTFHINKYTRHSGKFVGNVTFFPGNLYFSSPDTSPEGVRVKMLCYNAEIQLIAFSVEAEVNDLV